MQTAGQWAISGAWLTIWTPGCGTWWCVGRGWTVVSVPLTWASPWGPGPHERPFPPERLGGHVDSVGRQMTPFKSESWNTVHKLIAYHFLLSRLIGHPLWDLMLLSCCWLRMMNCQIKVSPQTTSSCLRVQKKIQQAQCNNETVDECVNEVLQACLKSSSDELEHKQLRCSRERFKNKPRLPTDPH